MTDPLNNNIKIPEGGFKRIVSLVPSQTELLYDLGLEDEVLGITKFCVHPFTWFKSKKRVGGTKRVNLKTIKELNPDLIIANKEENTKEDVEALSKDWPVYVSDIKDLNDAIAMIRDIGALTMKELQAANIIHEIERQFLFTKRLAFGSAIYLIWNNPIMVSGQDTFISNMMSYAGFTNLAKADRYPEYSIEELKILKPKYLLLSSEPFPFNETHKSYFEALLPGTVVILVDGEMFSWYGSRLLKAFDYFRGLHESS